jgi:hypothetical protein
MRKFNLLVITLLIISVNSYSQKKADSNKTTEKENLVFRDLVPNKETAIKIAEAVWLPIYGEKVYNERPFVARLKNSKIWIVEGTLHNTKGGVAYIEIQKKDGKVLKVYHEK